jgi:hypothetical protein
MIESEIILRQDEMSAAACWHFTPDSNHQTATMQWWNFTPNSEQHVVLTRQCDFSKKSDNASLLLVL